MPVLIGIAGLKRSGKDTAADALCAARRYQKVSFADPVRRAVRATLDPCVERKFLYDDDFKQEIIPIVGKSRRQLEQTLGTEWGRNLINPRLWINLAQCKINEAFSYGRSVVVSDIRFEDEAATIRGMGGAIVHMVRPDQDLPSDIHSSEAGVSRQDGDLTMVNDGTLEELRRKAIGLHHLLLEVDTKAG